MPPPLPLLLAPVAFRHAAAKSVRVVPAPARRFFGPLRNPEALSLSPVSCALKQRLLDPLVSGDQSYGSVGERPWGAPKTIAELPSGTIQPPLLTLLPLSSTAQPPAVTVQI